MESALQLPKTLPRATSPLLHHESPWLLPFHIPVHADVATRANTMQPALRLPKTLLRAT